MVLITVELKDVNCKDCGRLFPRTSRSKLCSPCAIKRKKLKKSARNKKYYKKKKEQKPLTVDMS